MTAREPTNDTIAGKLEKIADLLDQQDDNPFRVRSYRDAAASVRAHEESVTESARKDPSSLENIPGVGTKLAGTIEEFVRTGRIPILERLEASEDPEKVLQRVPAIGPELASRIVDELGVTDLEELERAAHDGRLRQIEGFGAGRVQSVRDSLAGILSRSASSRARRRSSGAETEAEKPPVDLLLKMDNVYRRRAYEGDLKRIAPRRFNPEGEAWLPIMHDRKAGWRFTLLYSNTQRAHELGTVWDWVVIYYERDGKEGQCTIVTSHRGALEGKRVVRGREPECRDYYEGEGE